MSESAKKPEPDGKPDTGGAPDSGAVPDTDAAPDSGDPFLESIKDVELPELEEVHGWVGARLDEIGGAAVGKIEGVFADPLTRDPTWLLARMGRFGHYSAIPFSHAVAGAGRVWIPYDRAQIRSAPQVEADAELTREDELRFCEHFSIPTSTGRAAEVEKRDQGSITSIPG